MEGLSNKHFNWNVIFGIALHMSKYLHYCNKIILRLAWFTWFDSDLDIHFKLKLVILVQIHTNVHEFACFPLVFAFHSANNRTVAKVQTAVLLCW